MECIFENVCLCIVWHMHKHTQTHPPCDVSVCTHLLRATRIHLLSACVFAFAFHKPPTRARALCSPLLFASWTEWHSGSGPTLCTHTHTHKHERARRALARARLHHIRVGAYSHRRNTLGPLRPAQHSTAHIHANTRTPSTWSKVDKL